MELARYLVLNPVRARMVREPGEWPWSSYGAMVGDPSPQDTGWTRAGFLRRSGRRRPKRLRHKLVSLPKVKANPHLGSSYIRCFWGLMPSWNR